MKKKLISDRYEIIKELGRGAGGVTYLVQDRNDPDLPKALKIINAESQDEALRLAFRQECQLLKKLSHPNIACVLESGADEDSLYYTTEYVEGEDFVSACRERDWNAVFSLIVQACWGLDYLHKQKVIHRDLKPANILVGKIHESDKTLEMESVRLKIIDFGLALSAAQQSHAMETAGTLGYMAPEVLAGDAYDGRADLYSLGVVLYEMALGRLPTTKTTNFSEYLQALHQHRVDMAPLHDSDEIPGGIVSIIENLVIADPEKRLKSAREVIKLLNKREDESFTLTVPSSETKGRSQAKRKKAPIKRATSSQTASAQEKVDSLLSMIRSGRQQEARDYIENELGSFDAEKDAGLVEEFYGAAGHVLTEQGQFDQVHDLINKMEKHPALRGKVSIEQLILAVQLAYREGKLDEAKKKLGAVTAKQLKKASLQQQTRVETYRGLVLQGLKEFDEAVKAFERGAAMAAESGRKDHQVGLLANAATLYYDQGQWGQAYEMYCRAEKLARAGTNTPLLGTILNNLGNLYLYFGRQKQAEQALEESLHIAEEQGLSELIAYNRYLLSTGEIGKGNREKVADYLRQALEYARGLGGSQALFQARLAEAYFHLSQDDFEACNEDLRLLRECAGETGQAAYDLQVDWFEARFRIQENSFADYPVADWLQAVHDDVVKRQLPNSLWQVLKDKGDLAKALGNEAEAQQDYQRALEVIEELKARVPKKYQESFMRDRKKEKIRRSLELLKPSETAEPAEPADKSDVTFSFKRWAEINRRLLMQYDIDQLLEEILDTALRITDAERGFVILSDEQNLDIRAARNFDKQTLNPDAEEFSFTIARDVMRKGESTVSLDAAADERFAEARSVHSLKIRSVLCVPLHLGQRTVGLIYLDNRYRPGVLINEHIELIEALADQASLTLEHARLHRENKEKIEELQLNKQLIEKLNERLEKDLSDTSAHLDAMRESMKREHEEISLRYSYDNIIGKSPGIKKVLSVIDRVVETHSPVFICGESGTGKELIARAFHFNGPRKGGPFIAENCAALADNLLESELFGHVRGAFTGAEKDRAGLFQMAHRGTLFLDEVGDMSLAMQAKLLRVLQEGEVRKVGGRDYQKVDVRVIAASHKDIRKMVTTKEFRQDLYYRLNVVRVDLPPLRDRGEDILLLADYFLSQQAEEAGKRKPRLSKGAIRVLLDYSWPGNIRELQNEMQRLLILGADVISPSLLSPQLIEGVQSQRQRIKDGGLEAIIAPIEKQAILEALQRCRGNKVKAAQLLKIGRRTLYMKLKEHNISPHWGKASASAAHS